MKLKLIIENLYPWLEKYSPVLPNQLIIWGVYFLAVFLTIYLFFYSIRAIKKRKIRVKIRGLSEQNFEGREAVRIGWYYLIAAIFIAFSLINVLLLDLSVSFDPFSIYFKGVCVYFCQ